MEIRVARIFNTFGPRMHMNDGRVVSNFILQTLQNKDITVSLLFDIVASPCCFISRVISKDSLGFKVESYTKVQTFRCTGCCDITEILQPTKILSFGEEWYCDSLGIVIGFCVVQKLWQLVISLLLLKILLEAWNVLTIQRAIHTIKGDNSVCFFFSE